MKITPLLNFEISRLPTTKKAANIDMCYVSACTLTQEQQKQYGVFGDDSEAIVRVPANIVLSKELLQFRP
jgi:hypothetical protein